VGVNNLPRVFVRSRALARDRTLDVLIVSPTPAVSSRPRATTNIDDDDGGTFLWHNEWLALRSSASRIHILAAGGTALQNPRRAADQAPATSRNASRLWIIHGRTAGRPSGVAGDAATATE